MDDLIVSAPPGGLEWLTREWDINSEAQARALARPLWGVLAWIGLGVVLAVGGQAISVVGAPLAVLLFWQMRETPPAWLTVLLFALTAFVATVGWAHGPVEWTNGVGEFKLLLVLYAARCAWARLRLPAVSHAEAVEVFS